MSLSSGDMSPYASRMRQHAKLIAIVSAALLAVATVIVVLVLRSGGGVDEAILNSCDDLGLVPCRRQVTRVSLPLAGTGIRLVYASDRVPGRHADPSAAVASTGLVGWSLSVLDGLDPATGLLVTGTGERRSTHPVGVGDGGLAVIARDGRTVDVFDASGRQTATYDALTGTAALRFAYGPRGLETVSDRAGVALTVRRDALGVPVRLDAARGPTTALGVLDGHLRVVQYPDGTRTSIVTAASGLVTSWTDGTGATTGYTYDRDGRTISRRDPSGSTVRYARVVDGDTLTVTTISATGARTIDRVQDRGDDGVRRDHTEPNGATTRIDARGSHRVVTPSRSPALDIDLAGDPRWGTDAPVIRSVGLAGATADAVAHEQRTAPAGAPDRSAPLRSTLTIGAQVWSYAFDPGPRRMTATGPDGSTSTTTFDTRGRLTSRGGTAGIPVGYAYDARGRVVAVTVGTGNERRVWHYAYDAGKVTITDPLGREQSRTSGWNGTLASVSGPGDTGLSVVSDTNGHVTGFAGPDGGAYRIARRPDGLPTAVTAPAGTGGARFTGYDYDADGRLVALSSATGRLTVTRDHETGRVASYDAGAGAWTAGYDAGGSLTSWQGPGVATTTTYTAGQVTGQRFSGPFDVTVSRTADSSGRTVTEQVGSAPTIRYGYDARGALRGVGALMLTRDTGTGAVTTEKLGRLIRTWTRNQFGEPTVETITLDNGSPLAALRWDRDGIGRVTREVTEVAGQPTITVAYTYDDAGRLSSFTRDGSRTKYRYDADGDPILVAPMNGSAIRSEYDGRDALIRRGNTTYTYDGFGRLATATGPDGTTSYAYDANGVLGSVTPPTGATITYLNDATGRRIATKIGDTLTGGVVYRDGLRPAAEVDATGAVTTRYVYSGSTVPAYVTKAGTDYLEVTDATGSPALILSARDGTVADRVVRDPFGAVVSESAPGFQAVGFAGGVVDPATGLVRFGARDYLASAARWTAPDPLGIGAGNANLYAYVSDDPVNLIDPTGLCEYVSLGLSGGLAIGPVGGRLGLGIARAGGQWGFYLDAGSGYGAEGHLTGDFKCQDRDDETGTPTLADFGGFDKTLDIGVGPAELSKSWDDTTHGIGISFGPAAGIGFAPGYGWTACVFGCSPEPPEKSLDEQRYDGLCGGVDAGTCDPYPGDPSIGMPDDSTSARDVCEGAGSCNDPGRQSSVPSGSGPNSVGDPHLRTADGTVYDLQAVGEFTALATDDGDLTVQTRQRAAPGSRTVSVNTAVAVKTRGDRVVATLSGTDGIAIDVDGHRWNVIGTVALPHGATLYRDAHAVAIRTAAGNLIGVTRNPDGLDLSMDLAASARDHTHGLLGPYTGHPGSGLETKGGTRIDLDRPPSHTTLYDTFAASWRVTDVSSLFDYDRGESSATFTDRNFPDPNAPGPSTVDTQTARKVCQALGIAAESLAGCVLDVATTGNAGFAVSTAAVLRSGSTGTAGAGAPVATPPVTAAPVPAESVVAGGTIHDGDTGGGSLAAGQHDRYLLDLGDARFFYLTDWRTDGTSGCSNTVFVAVVGQPGGGYPCPGTGKIYAVPPAGTARLEFVAGTNATAALPYGFRIVAVKQRTFTIGLGDTVSAGHPAGAGRLDTAGRVDRFEFDAAGATSIIVTGRSTGCANVTLDIHEVGTPADADVPGAGGIHDPCSGAFTYPVSNPAGRYVVVIVSTIAATVDYSFRVDRG